MTKRLRIWMPVALMAMLAAGLTACSSAPEEESPLAVFAASSLQDVVPNLAARFEDSAHGCPVKYQFAGSQQLATQLHHGAKADVFLSADKRQTERLIQAGLASGPAVPFAANRLVLIASRGAYEKGLTGLEALSQPGWKLVLAAPEVPAGFYTRQLLERLQANPQFGPERIGQLRANVVSRESNVRATASKVALGEADAAIVYATDAAPLDQQRVETIPLPDGDAIPATYYAVALRDAARPEEAQRWLHFLQAGPSRRMLQQFGFRLP